MQIKKLLAPLAVAVCFGTMSLVLTASAQTTTYPLSTLTGPNDFNFLLQVQAVKFENGKWTYNFVWNRTRDAQGTVVIAPKVNENVRVAELDPAPKAKTVDSPFVVQLNAATRYVFRYYAVPGCNQDSVATDPECVPIREIYFNTRDQSGKTLDTSEIALSNGGTKANTTASDVLSTITNSGIPANSSVESLQNMVNQLMAMVQALLAQIGGSTTTNNGVAMCDYSEPPTGCSYVNGPSYNATTQCGKVLSCGSATTTIVTNATTLDSGLAALPGDQNLPIGKGGAKMNCAVPAPTTIPKGAIGYNSNQKARVYLTTDMWTNCLGATPEKINAAGGTSWDTVTFDNGVKLPGSLFQNLFNNYPAEIAYRKAYKIIHQEPFANNPIVTSPDDPEAAVNLPYVDGPYTTNSEAVPGDIDLTYMTDLVYGSNPFNQGKSNVIANLYPNMSYNARWEVKDRLSYPQNTLIPTNIPDTVDIYVYSLQNFGLNTTVDMVDAAYGSDLTCAQIYKPNYKVDMERYDKCRKDMQSRLSEEASGKVFGFGGKGYVLVAQNVPYKNGKAQFFVPYTRNISYSGRPNKPLIGTGPVQVVVFDSKATPFINQMEGKVAFNNFGIYNPDPYSGAPLFTNEQKRLKYPISSLSVDDGVKMFLNKNSDIKMETVGNQETGPMPWTNQVINPGFGDYDVTGGHRFDNDYSKIITVEGGTDRPFWMTIYYVQHREHAWSPLSPAPQVSFEGSLPPGLSLSKNAAYLGTSEPNTVPVGAIIGSPSAGGTYIYDVKTRVVQGGKNVEGITRYIFNIKPTTKSEMRLEDLSGNSISSARTGDTIRIKILNDKGKIASDGHPTLYLAPIGSGCNRSDPKNYDTCAGSTALHPDWVKKVAISNSLSNQPCNNFGSGGSDPLVAWSCSEYQWRVGNVPGNDLSSGSYVIYAMANERTPQGNSGEYFWAAAQLNVTQGTQTESTSSRGTSAAPSGNINNMSMSCSVNGRDVDCYNHPSGFMGYAQGFEYQNSEYVRTASFTANVGDTVTLNYSAKIPGGNLTVGNDWGSTIELYPTLANQGQTDEGNKRCTAALVPGGFGRQSVDFTSKMGGPEGSVSFTIPDCMRGSAFIINYTAYTGCNRTDGLDCAFTKNTIRMGVGIRETGGTSSVPVDTSPVCNISPDMFYDLRGGSSQDGKSFSAVWGMASKTFDRLIFRAGTDLDAVKRGCTTEDLSSGKCILRTGDPGTSYPNGLPKTMTGIDVPGSRPDTTYWVRVAAVCDYAQPNQRYVDATWQVSTESQCTFGVLGNCSR